MFKIAKSIDTFDEQVEIKTVESSVGHFDVKTKKSIYKKINMLEISLLGKINKDEYCLNFIISKPIEEYFNIKKYETMNIKESEFIDSYFSINDESVLDVEVDIKILRFDKKIIFSLTFRSADDEYFGIAEFETELSKLKNENKKIEE